MVAERPVDREPPHDEVASAGPSTQPLLKEGRDIRLGLTSDRRGRAPRGRREMPADVVVEGRGRSGIDPAQ